MNEKDTQKKQNTAIKTVDIVLCIGIVISVVFNVYQFNSNNILKSEIDTIEADIEALGNENSILDQDIENKKNTLSSLSKQIEDLNSTITTLEADNKSLTDSLQELQKQLEEKEAETTTTNDYGLTEEEQAMLEEMEQEVMRSHPEWFSDTNPNKGTGNQGNFENVGTPSTGQVQNPNYTVGESGGEGISDNITIY